MKITEELLRRHLLGESTEEERRAIKKWFEQSENVHTGLQMLVVSEQDKQDVWSMIQEQNPELETIKVPTKVIPLFQKAARYAAVACIVFAAFLGGRFSVSTAHATEVKAEAPKDLLHLVGSHGITGQFLGDAFNIKLDGTIKLSNDGYSTKTVFVGDTSFQLAPGNQYFFSGSTESPIMSNVNSFQFECNPEPELEGSFSLLRVDIR